MLATRVLAAVIVMGLALLAAGCGRSSYTVVTMSGMGAKSASEERNLTVPHVGDAGIDVRTDVGSVEVVADPAVAEVSIAAKVTAYGETDEEARSRLPAITVTATRRDDRVLAIVADCPADAKGIRGSCSLVIRIPGVSGSTVRTGNGSITLEGLGGAADAHTGVGSITVTGQGGNLTAETGNGSVRVAKAAAEVEVKTGVGSVAVGDVAGAVRAESGNGSIEVTNARASVEIHTSVGSVTVRDAAGPVSARTQNGTVTVAKVAGAVKATSSVGTVTVDQVSGEVEARTGNGSITCTLAPGPSVPFDLETSVGSVTVRVPAGAGGSIDASTSVGNVTVDGPRRPVSVVGERSSKVIVLTEDGPSSRVRTGNGNITITLE